MNILQLAESLGVTIDPVRDPDEPRDLGVARYARHDCRNCHGRGAVFVRNGGQVLGMAVQVCGCAVRGMARAVPELADRLVTAGVAFVAKNGTFTLHTRPVRTARAT